MSKRKPHNMRSRLERTSRALASANHAAVVNIDPSGQQQRRQKGDQERYSAMPGDEVNADNTVPVAPLMGEHVRQGLLVDIEV